MTTRLFLHINKTRFIAVVMVCAMSTALALPSVKVFAEEAGPITDNNKTITSAEVSEALRETSGVLEASDQVQTTSDADSALKAVTAGVAVDVPKDASEGVSLGSTEAGAPSIDIALPNAASAGDAKQVTPSAVAYPGDNGAANAVQPTEDGGVQMLTVIDNPNAPTTYDYAITVPGGGHVELTLDGGAIVLDDEGKPVAVIQKPWAKDANEAPVETYFTTDGTHLTQHIKHNVAGVAYPVTADPRVSYAWHGVTYYLSRWETNLVAWSAGAAGAYFGWTGIGGLIAYAAGPAAQWATNHGYCLAIYKSHFVWGLTPWAYRC